MLDPSASATHGGLASALLKAGRNEEAVEAYGRAVELDRNSAEAHRGLGRALALTGRLAEALESYRRADEIRGRHGWGHLDPPGI